GVVELGELWPEAGGAKINALTLHNWFKISKFFSHRLFCNHYSFLFRRFRSDFSSDPIKVTAPLMVGFAIKNL
ncbi:MAG: hypothetical protein ACPHM6_13805, partial [Paracoccaceae bacterium]